MQVENKQVLENQPNLYFSARFKESDISLISNKARREVMSHYQSVFVLIDRSLTQSTSTVFEWKIGINCCFGVCAVGICSLFSMMSKKFKFIQFTSNWHGLYAIENNGSQYKGVDLCFKKASFRLNTGDSIKLIYSRNILRFQKGNLKEQVMEPQSGDSYYPCIFLGRQGDEMELLQFRQHSLPDEINNPVAVKQPDLHKNS